MSEMSRWDARRRMTPNTARWIRMVLSNLIKGSIAAGSAFMAALTQLKLGEALTSTAVLLVVVGRVRVDGWVG